GQGVRGIHRGCLREKAGIGTCVKGRRVDAENAGEPPTPPKEGRKKNQGKRRGEEPRWTSMSDRDHPPLSVDAPRFMFATGIEGSYPTIQLPNGQSRRMDEFAKTRHYRHWREDIALDRESGIEYLRYGPPYFSVHS